MKKLIALLLGLMLTLSGALADIDWPADLTAGQRQLQTYIDVANAALAENGGGVINMMYEMYVSFASLGMDGIEMPEDPLADFTNPVEIYVSMGSEGLHSLQLRMQDANRFALVAAACIHAASPAAMSFDEARAITNVYAGSVLSTPNRSFSEDVNTLQGAQPRAYFSYAPNQFGDNHNWLQMTLVFARPGSADAYVVVPASTPAPEDATDQVWLSSDNYSHLEIFTTPTPEPDSAAME